MKINYRVFFYFAFCLVIFFGAGYATEVHAGDCTTNADCSPVGECRNNGAWACNGAVTYSTWESGGMCYRQANCWSCTYQGNPISSAVCNNPSNTLRGGICSYTMGSTICNAGSNNGTICQGQTSSVCSGWGGTGPVCGDGICNTANGETNATCPADCPATGLYCGDGICNNGETSVSCSTDCPVGTFTMSMPLPWHQFYPGDTFTYPVDINTTYAGTMSFAISACPPNATCTLLGGNTINFTSASTDDVVQKTLVVTAGSIAFNAWYYPTVTGTINGNSQSANQGALLVAGTNDAQCLSIVAPSTVAAGSTFTGTITMKNIGTKRWDNIYTSASDGPHSLGSNKPWDNTFWGPSSGRTPLPSSPILSGQTAVFTATFVAPPTPGGPYPFEFKMVEDGVEWFPFPGTTLGGCSLAGGITVTSACTPPTTGTMTAPATANVNSTFGITCDYGSSSDYIPAPTGCTWPGSNGGHIGSASTFTCTAPATAQNVTYTCQAQTFPGFTQFCSLPAATSKTVTVTAALRPAITFTASPTTGPSPMSTSLSWSVANNSTSCTASSNPPSFWNGSTSSFGFANTSGITVPTTYTLSCTNANGNSSASVTVTPVVAATYSINITKTSGGSVKSVDGLIDCGTTCANTYTQNSTVTLKAYPDSTLWQFTGWTGACSGTGDCTLVVNGSKTVSALFQRRPLIYQEF